MVEKRDFSELEADVVEKGLCMGCGTCAGICPVQCIEMDYEADEPEPKLATNECTECGLCYAVCPGADIPLPELDETFLGKKRNFEEDKIGIFQNCYRGYATDEYLRMSTSSGGMVSGLLSYALEKKMIDAATIAGWREDKPWRCRPLIATNTSELQKGLRTGMMMVPNNAVLHKAVNELDYEKIAVVGCPCHIHGLRKLQHLGKPKKLVDALQFMIGVFCASTYYWEGTKHLLKEYGKIPKIEDIKLMDYRGGKWPGSLLVVTKDDKIHWAGSKHDYTWHLFGPATYKRDRCLMCVDFSSELADVSCGDIFQKTKATSRRLVATLTRTEIGEDLVEKAKAANYIDIEEHDPTLIPASGMGWESKKHANVYRIKQRSKYGWPVPDFHYTLTEHPLPRDLKFPE